MGCTCSKSTKVADSAIDEVPSEAGDAKKERKKSGRKASFHSAASEDATATNLVRRTSQLSAVDKSLLKREKSLHMDAPSRHRRLSVDLSAEGRSFDRSNSVQIATGTPEDALHELVKGNARFILGESQNPHQGLERLTAIAPKQFPFAAILACADSRAPVEIIFDQGFGDIFCCRIAGNIASAEQIASLEYAVLDLGVKVIMVMGHTSCGAVKAACSGQTFPGFIDLLVNSLDVAVARAQTNASSNYQDLTDKVREFESGSQQPCQELIERVIRENVIHQIHRCRNSAIISEAVQRGSTILVPALYHIDTGEVELLEP